MPEAGRGDLFGALGTASDSDTVNLASHIEASILFL